MAAFELAVAYLVSGAFELGNDSAAAGVDREPSVPGPVRDKDTRRARLACWCKESRRKGDYAREEVAVRNYEREGVGGTVGEARYRQLPGIQCQAVEHLIQRPVDELEVWAVASHEHVPLSLRSSCLLRGVRIVSPSTMRLVI